MKRIKKNKKVSILSFVTVSILIVSFLGVGTVTAAQWNVGEGKDYTTIQSAIDNVNTLDDDIINVYSGVYDEDVVLNKKLTIQANLGDTVELKPTKTGFTIVNDVTGDGSGSNIHGFKITNYPTGIGFNISADNCNIEGNEIIGGKTGIVVSHGNNTLVNNVISGQSENGVLGNLSEGFFTFSGNNISNIIGEGLANGISITVNGNLTDFNAIGNIITNISTFGANSGAFGIQLGKSKGAGGNPEVANVTNLTVIRNIITDINSYGANSAIMGMELVSNSINAIISENNLSKLKGSVNSSVFALEAAIIGNGTVLVSKNQISQIIADEQAVGIVAVALGDLILKDNLVSKISNARAAVAILGLGLLNNGTLENNSVSDITSPNIAGGIIGTSLGHLDMLYNNVIRVKGANNVYLVTAGFNSTSVKGNNLEGDGSGNGIVICSPNGTINYNRIVNFDYYIQNFKFSSFGPDIDEMLKPIDDAIKNHPELEPILKPIRDDLDKLFHELENSNTTALYNWYGTNDPNDNNFFKGNGTLVYSPWLVLNINADPSTIHVGQTSTITADVYRDSAGNDHSADWAQFFSGPEVTFNTNLGNVGSKSITVPWINGLAAATLIADEGAGIATIMAVDYQTVQTFVTILGESGETVTKTIGMQETGIPVAVLILAILTVLSGLISKRN